MSFATGMAGGGGMSASSSAGPVDGTGGSLSQGSTNFGGIQTGGNNMPPWVMMALIGLAAFMLLKRK